MPFFDKPVLMTTPAQGLMNFLYHFSEQHVLPSNTRRLNLLSFEPELKVLAFKLANNSVDLFLRANRTTQVQVHQGTRWCLTKQELGTQQQWSPDHEMGFEHLFDQMS